MYADLAMPGVGWEHAAAKVELNLFLGRDQIPLAWLTGCDEAFTQTWDGQDLGTGAPSQTWFCL